MRTPTRLAKRMAARISWCVCSFGGAGLCLMGWVGGGGMSELSI